MKQITPLANSQTVTRKIATNQQLTAHVHDKGEGFANTERDRAAANRSSNASRLFVACARTQHAYFGFVKCPLAISLLLQESLNLSLVSGRQRWPRRSVASELRARSTASSPGARAHAQPGTTETDTNAALPGWPNHLRLQNSSREAVGARVT